MLALHMLIALLIKKLLLLIFKVLVFNWYCFICLLSLVISSLNTEESYLTKSSISKYPIKVNLIHEWNETRMAVFRIFYVNDIKYVFIFAGWALFRWINCHQCHNPLVIIIIKKDLAPSQWHIIATAVPKEEVRELKNKCTFLYPAKAKKKKKKNFTKS